MFTPTSCTSTCRNLWGGRNGGVGDGRKEWWCGRWEEGMAVWEMGGRNGGVGGGNEEEWWCGRWERGGRRRVKWEMRYKGKWGRHTQHEPTINEPQLPEIRRALDVMQSHLPQDGLGPILAVQGWSCDGDWCLMQDRQSGDWPYPQSEVAVLIFKIIKLYLQAIVNTTCCWMWHVQDMHVEPSLIPRLTRNSLGMRLWWTSLLKGIIHVYIGSSIMQAPFNQLLSLVTGRWAALFHAHTVCNVYP